MQDERKIVIEVVERGAAPTPDRPKPENQTPSEEAVDQTGKSDALLLGKSVFWNQMFEQARNQIVQLGSTAINRYFQMREDYRGEQTFNNAKIAIGKGISAVSTVVSGARIGSKAGPYGAIAGAAIAAIGWIGNEFVQGNNRIANAKIALNTQEYESAFQRSRAGLMDGGRGTRG